MVTRSSNKGYRSTGPLWGLHVKKMSSSKVVRNTDVANYGVCQGGKVGQGSSQVVNPQVQPLAQQPQLHKKKVRRRLHTSRPYQERLLNMAEARREIVTALKFHRASMKRQQQRQQEEPLQVVDQPPLPTQSADTVGMNPAKSPVMIQPSDGGSSSFDKYHQPYHMFNPSAAAVPSVSSFSFALPSQTLGLNLNFQDFSNLSTSHFQTNPSLFASPSSSSSSPAISSTATDEIHSAAEDAHSRAFLVSQTDNMAGAGGVLSPYPAMDSEVMKEIKSMDECYDIVWNDTMNSLTSAWWLKFSNAAAEVSTEDSKQAEDEHMFTQLSWLNPADSYLPPYLNIAFPEDSSSPDPSLPCMDIGEIEGMDGDWFA